MRTSLRLLGTLRKNNGRNWLASICPPLVLKTVLENDIQLSSRMVFEGVAIATWKSGRRQQVFGNSAFAKAVRCVLTDHLDES